MRTLLVDFITSLEGCASAVGWPGFWGVEAPEYLAWLEQAPERNWTVLMGATTYRLMSGFASAGEEDLEELTRARKVVFSSTLSDPLEWANSELVSTDPIDRFRTVLFPVVTGSTGTERIYEGWPDVGLELVDSRLFDGRLQLLECAPTVLAGPPG